MIERLTDADDAQSIAGRLRELIETRSEWFYAEAAGASTIALRKSECDFRVSHGRLIFSCWGSAGALVWRITGWEWTGEKLLLEAQRRMGAKVALLELIPRAPSSLINRMVSANRRALCERLAHLAREQLKGAKIERQGLSTGARRGQPGRYARVHLRSFQERIAVSGAVVPVEPGEIDALLSSALIWFKRARQASTGPKISTGPPTSKLWLIIQSNCIEAAQQRLALLREDLSRCISLYEIDENWQELAPARSLQRAELWAEKPARLPLIAARALSEWATRILALAPEAIDVVHARHGETLRFHGLPFARVRRLMKREHVWFGTEAAGHRHLLNEDSWPELTSLVAELKEHRRAESQDHHHAFYRAAPETWLESMLRRDITRLDPGLIIAPLYAQFRPSRANRRAGSRPVDLLALRRDGRLVVIELKVNEDREHVLQGADYWRRVEAQRRCGHLAHARLFGDATIQDQPPLVYLVAPTLRFHRAFNTLAQTLAPDIEVYRFDLNEDWRTGVRVMRRETLTNSLQ